MAARPLIGITMRLERDTRRFYLGRDYSEAVHAAGGTPVHLSLIPDADHIAEVVAKLDGILLPGADCDPDPTLYAEEPHPKLGAIVPEKDAVDLAVIEEAERRRLPILGICYGMQILNVARGGSLIQDIPSLVPEALEHQQGIPRERATHTIRIEEGSLLATLNANGSENAVNSHHHQAVNAVGSHFQPVAWASDGMVEAIEDTRPGRFCLGVQWHPELAWKENRFCRSIFEHFVGSAASRNP